MTMPRQGLDVELETRQKAEAALARRNVLTEQQVRSQ